MSLKIVSWNVNGIRAALKKGFESSMESLDADIICLQETKANREQVEFEFRGYRDYWYSAERKGYSGTLVFTKEEPLSYRVGLGDPEHDREGRVQTLEFDDFFLVNVYTPNAKRDLSRLPYRTEKWDADFLAHVIELEKTKPVVFCGDLNVAHQEIDLANPKTNRKNAGFTPEERGSFNRLVEAGFVDSFREFEKEGGHYTWWSQRPGLRERNIGWRIDYFCVSSELRPRLKKAGILPQIFGSDHCPIYLELS